MMNLIPKHKNRTKKSHSAVTLRKSGDLFGKWQNNTRDHVESFFPMDFVDSDPACVYKDDSLVNTYM